MHFGYKGFWRSDGEGYVERVLVRPANEGEAPHLPHLLKGCTAVRVLADKAYSSKTNRAVLGQQGFKSGIMYRARRNHPLSARQKRFNRLVAKQRWVIEQSFGTLKRLFHGGRARYMTREKVEAEQTFKAVAMNLLKAANRINLVAA
ncbi:MAG: transposase [Hyphomonadaceae bacterium]|nr:transposase [Hyphomonadaceae bacterium]